MKRLERLGKRFLSSLLRLVIRRKAVTPESLKPDRILVIRQHNQLGDMLCAIPLLNSLRSSFPRSTITLMASPVNFDVMRHHPALDELINYDKRVFRRGKLISPAAVLRFVRDLRRRRFDLAIVPMTVSFSFSSSLLSFLSGAAHRVGAETIDGGQNPAGSLFNLPVALDWRTEPHRHQTLRNADTMKDFLRVPEDLSCRIRLTDQERSAARSEVEQEDSGRRIRVALHPGAGKIPNQWPASGFARVADTLHREEGAALWLTEGPMDEDAAAAMRTVLTSPITVVRGRPLREVAAILSCMDLVISNDTGIMHVAAAVGVPVLSLFGPTDPHQWAPVGPRHRSIRKGDDIGSITVEEVAATAKEMLG